MKPAGHICLATPYYLGEECADYGDSYALLSRALLGRNIILSKARTIGDAVNRQRNVLTAVSLASKADTTAMIDSDIGFHAAEIIRMYDSGLPVVTANVPQRRYDASRLAGHKFTTPQSMFERMLVPTIAAIENPEERNGCVEVAYASTSIMLIRRYVFEDIIKAGLVPKLTRGSGITPETLPHFYRFFSFACVDGDDMGEDWHFCDLVRKAGHKVFCDPLTIASHTGPHTWTGKPTWPNQCISRAEVNHRMNAKETEPKPFEPCCDHDPQYLEWEKK